MPTKWATPKSDVPTSGHRQPTRTTSNRPSLNSIEDFADNIRSIRNAYLGTNQGDASVSDYIKSISPETDAAVRNAISNAITAIEAVPEPFEKNATGALAATAMEAAGSTLVDALEDANSVLTRH